MRHAFGALTSNARKAATHPRATAAHFADQAVSLGAGGLRLTARLAGAALRAAGVGSPPDPARDEWARGTEVRTPPIRRTAEEAVAREQAAGLDESAEVPEELAADVTTPSGIPAADVGHNPDTTETDLHQPGTEPLMDPSSVKAAASEAETMRRAAERNPD